MGLYVAPKLLFSKVIPDKGFYDFKGKDIKNINKLTCSDYFGAFVPTESDTVRLSKIFDPVLTAPSPNEPGVQLEHLFDSFSYTIPSVYASGKVRVKVTVNFPGGDGQAGLIIRKISITGVEGDIWLKTFTSAFSGVVSADISISAGDKLMLKSYTANHSTYTISQIDVCADETELFLNTGFDWEEWQE